MPLGSSQRSATNSLWSFALLSYCLLTSSAAVVVAGLWGHRSQIPRERLQSRVILGTAVLALALVIVDWVRGFGACAHTVPGVSAAPLLFLMGGVHVAMVRYRLMSLTPAVVAPEILRSMSESDRIDQALERAKRYRTHVGVMFVDLDKFKRINDTQGHEAGDVVLRAVALRLAACVRKSDTVARIGGGEFALVLPDLNDLSAVTIIDGRLRGGPHQLDSLRRRARSATASA